MIFILRCALPHSAIWFDYLISHRYIWVFNCCHNCLWRRECRSLAAMTKTSHGRKFGHSVLMCLSRMVSVVCHKTWKINGRTCAKLTQNRNRRLLLKSDSQDLVKSICHCSPFSSYCSKVESYRQIIVCTYNKLCCCSSCVHIYWIGR